jgi:hypothetical protein
MGEGGLVGVEVGVVSGAAVGAEVTAPIGAEVTGDDVGAGVVPSPPVQSPQESMHPPAIAASYKSSEDPDSSSMQ